MTIAPGGRTAQNEGPASSQRDRTQARVRWKQLSAYGRFVTLREWTDAETDWLVS